MREKKILLAPLNWGLGHAARCVPLISELLGQGHEIRLASDGNAGIFLQKQFPHLPYHELPGYGVTYPKSGFYLHWLRQFPKLVSAVVAENKYVQELASRWRPDVIISDNRYGAYSSGAKNIIITHQLTIDLVAPFNFLIGRFLKNRVERFDQCWVPDFDSDDNLSGKLSKGALCIPKYFVGSMSRFVRSEVEHQKTFDVCAVLSGPEPLRRILEEQLIQFFAKRGSAYRVAFVRGKPAEQDLIGHQHSTYNHLSSSDLRQLLLQSDMVISRAGYSSIMDYYRLNKKAILIPTPLQPEQKYLAARHACRSEFYVPEPDLSDLEKGIKILSGIEANLPEWSANNFPDL